MPSPAEMLAETIDAIRALHRRRIFLMAQRKAKDLSLGAFIRLDLGWHRGLPTEERRAIASRATEMIEAGRREKARAAAQRLREIISGSAIDLSEVRCSCRPGTEGTRDCNHGRRCATLTTGGNDVGEILIAEGLARPYAYDWSRPPPPAHWCGR